jgi:hypothetical protein
MFFFTIIIAFVYCVFLFDLMTKPGNPVIAGFPPLSDGLIALLAISHGGYLTEKAVPSTPTTFEESNSSPSTDTDQSKSAGITQDSSSTDSALSQPANSTPESPKTPESPLVSSPTTDEISASKVDTSDIPSQIAENPESPKQP